MTVRDVMVLHESNGPAYMPPRRLAAEFARDHETVIIGASAAVWRNPAMLPVKARLSEEADVRELRPLGLPRRYVGGVTAGLEARIWAHELRAMTHGRILSVWFDRPDQYPRVSRAGETVSVYYAHCDYKVDILGRRMPATFENEKKMIERVDVVFAATEALAGTLAAQRKDVYILPCGYDAGLFNAEALAAGNGSRKTGRPRIGFAGYISGRIDFEALYQLAERRRDWDLYLVGGMSPGMNAQLAQQGRQPDMWERLIALPNVTYAGEVELESVPALVATFDVALVPYVRSDFTMTSSPIKAYEYLALGRPVVSSRIPDLERLGGAIRFVDRTEEWESAIDELLPKSWDVSSTRLRQNAVAGDSNGERARYALQVIQEVAGGRR